MDQESLASRQAPRVAVFRTELLALSETFIRDQARALASWQPILVGRHELPNGLQTPGISRRLVPEGGSRAARMLRFWLRLPDPALTAQLKGLQVALVHAHFGVDATDIWPSVKAAGLPMLVTLHGFDINTDAAWWQAGHGGLYRRVYPRRLLNMARDPAVRFIAVSQAVQQCAIAYGIPADKVSVGYIGVDTRRFRQGGLPLAQRPKRILFVGRMVEKKAPLLMIRAFQQLRREVRDAELVMIGSGPLLGAAQALAHELAMPVLFLGAASSEEVLVQMHQARVFCLPSATAANGDSEGLPIALLEAQACGVPCVTTRHSGNPESIVEGQSGILVAENDLAGLAAALRFALMDAAFAGSAGEQARRNVEQRYALDRNTRALELAYEEIATQVRACGSVAGRLPC